MSDEAAPEEVDPEPEITLPSRRRRASEDDGDEDEFHDAASEGARILEDFGGCV